MKCPTCEQKSKMKKCEDCGKPFLNPDQPRQFPAWPDQNKGYCSSHKQS